MASPYEERLKEIALAEDEDARLQLAAEVDQDAEELNAYWENRDAVINIEAERDSLVQERDALAEERDSWKKKYADRFFDTGEGEADQAGINASHKKEVQEESRVRGYAALWNER